MSFAKKDKGKSEGGSSSASALAAKVGGSKTSSNLNSAAPRVALPILEPTLYTSDHIGSVSEVPAEVVAQLKALDVLRKQAGYQYFSQLASVLRAPTVQLADLINATGSSRRRRAIIKGPAGSGKSTAMLQAITLALQKKWVVIAMPRGEDIVDSSFSYAYDATRKSWKQDDYVAGLLKNIAEGNRDVLRLQNISKSYSFDRHTLPENSSLYKLLEIGAVDPVIAHDVLDVFLAEMNLGGRPPVLMTLDNISITTLPSRYRDADFQPVHPFDLEIIRTFIEYLNGSKELRDGAVLTCTSSVPACRPKSLNIALKEERRSPFEAVDPRIAEGIKGATVVEVGQYTSREAASIVQYYASAGLLRSHSSIEIPEMLARHRGFMSGMIGRDVFQSCLKQI